MIVHYVLSKKYKYAALTFSLFQSICTAATCAELTLLTCKSVDDMDGEGGQAAVLASIGVLSYNQTY
jgi:hypothetical protein